MGYESRGEQHAHAESSQCKCAPLNWYEQSSEEALDTLWLEKIDPKDPEAHFQFPRSAETSHELKITPTNPRKNRRFRSVRPASGTPFRIGSPARSAPIT